MCFYSKIDTFPIVFRVKNYTFPIKRTEGIKKVPEMSDKSGTECIVFSYNSNGVYASPHTLATAS